MAKSILNRMEGIFVIVNTFLPLILVIAIAIALNVTWQATKDSIQTYSNSLQQIVTQAEVAKKELQKVSNDIAKMAVKIQKNGAKISKDIDKVTGAFQKTVSGFDKVFENAVKKLNIPLKIPGIKNPLKINIGKVIAKPLGKVGGAIAKPFKPLSNSFKDLGKSVSQIKEEVATLAYKLEELKKMEIYLDSVIVEYKKIMSTIDSLASAIGRFFTWLFYGVLVLLVWFAFGYFLWVRRRLKTGIALLTGNNQPGMA